MEKSKWKVRAQLCKTIHVVVEAADYSEARDIVAAFDDHNFDVSDERHVDADILEEIDGPFVSGGWYDLHSVGDVCVFNARYGTVFTEKDIELLSRRLTAVGLKVIRHWNGAGCRQVSFCCSGRTDMRSYARLPESVYADPKE